MSVVTLLLNGYSLGRLDPATLALTLSATSLVDKARQERINNKPPLAECLNLHDFEVRNTLPPLWCIPKRV